MVFTFSTCVQATSADVYKDVKSGDWYYDDIVWATENHMTSGYDDGTFVPDAKITEAEFLKMLVSVYKGNITQKNDPHWYDAYYRFAEDHKWNVYGLLSYASNFARDNTIAPVPDKPLIRLKAAMILLNATGKEADAPDELIWALYNSKLSDGKTSRTVYGFQPNDLLTRAEAVSFIRNFKAKNSMNDLLPVTQSLEANRVLSMTRVVKTLIEMAEEHGYQFQQNSKLNRYVKEEGNILKGFRIFSKEDPSIDLQFSVSAEHHQRTIINSNLNNESSPLMREFLSRILNNQGYMLSILEAFDMMPKATPRSIDMNIPYNYSFVKFSTSSFNLSLDESDKTPYGYEGN